jgi:ferric-dicitrate binding protein FerR (iron transport regulator)
MNHGVTKDQIKALAEKWMQGTLSEEERAIFESWYNQHDESAIQWPGNETEEELQARIYNKVSAELNAGEKSGSLVPIRWWRRIAAAVLILLLGALAWYASTSRTSSPAIATRNPPVSEAGNKQTGFIRHITLPDGTNVVLQANSRLDYPESFMGSAREVILSGEAYFDVAHDTQKPFIIHTGRVRTTVLGTAFNIRALPDGKQITVSVTRGKVKVEDDRKLLAVLTPNQQVTYRPVTAAVSKDTVNAISLVTDWTKHEMVFEGQSFEEVASLLGRRYGVEILFNKEGLKRCTIKAFFNGTETLEKVLDVLCIISNATYSMSNDKTVLLDGAGCGE